MGQFIFCCKLGAGVVRMLSSIENITFNQVVIRLFYFSGIRVNLIIHTFPIYAV